MSHWSGDDWQLAYFGMPARRLPRGYRSHEREAWDSELEGQLRAEQARVNASADHMRALGELEQVERFRALVKRFGGEAVEAIMRRVDPTFALPACLRGTTAADWEE